MSTYMNKVVGNLEQTRTGFTTQERTTARQNIDLKASLFTSSDNSLNFEDLDNDTKQINVTSDAYSLTSNTGINIVPNDTDKTIAINHVTTTAADAAIVRVGKDVYGHVVLGTAITAADFKAVTYTDAKKTTDSDKYIYLLNGVATEGRIVLDVNPTNSGLKLDSSKYIQVNCGTNLAIGTDGKLNNTYTYTLPVASANNLGGIKIGYTTSDNARKYAVELDTSNKAYVNVPWTDTLANNGTLTIPVVTTSMKDGGGWVCTTATKTFTADQSTDTTFTTALAEYNHSHGALNYTGTLGYAPYCTTMGSAYIAANPSNNVSLVLTTGSYITKSDITFNSSYPDRVLTQAGTWVDRLTVASANNLGGIKIGYTTSGKNYAVQLDSSNKAYVNVPWEAANNGTLTIPYVTTSMADGGGWVCTPVTKTFTANQSTNTTIDTALAAYNHSHGALNYTGTLGYAPYCTSMGSAYIASTSNTVSLVLTTGSYITKSDISFLAGSNKILTQAGTWVDQYSYTLPAATSSALGGIKIGYTTSGKNYPVQLNSTNQAYVNVPWVAANNGTLTIPVVTTSMENGGGWVCTSATKTFSADQSTNTTFTTALAEYNHCHGALNYDGVLNYAPYCTAMGSAYIASTSNTVSLVLTTGSYITKSDISFLAGSNKILTQAGTWVDQYSYTLPAATSSALGGIKIGYTTSGKNYPVQLNTTNQAYVNVPWTDTHCTTSMFVTTKNGTSDQIIAADSTNKIYLALYDDTTLRSQHKIYGDGTIIKISSEAESGAGAAIKIDGSHNHGLLAQNGTLGQQSGFPSGTISSYLASNTSSKIEIPLAMTYKLTGSTWSTDYELTRGGIALSANGTRYLKEDGSWGTPTDTNSTTHLYAGASKTAANSAQTNGNVYLTVADDTNARDSINLVGSGGTTVTSDASGTVTITSNDILSISYTDESSGKTGDVKSIDYYNALFPDSHYNTMTLYGANKVELGRFYTLPTTMDKGILANTDTTGVYTIPATNGVALYEYEDEETGLCSAYIGANCNPNNMMIDSNGGISRAYGVVRFQNFAKGEPPRYTLLCSIKKRWQLNGGAANMNISLLATYSGTVNTNPSIINLVCRVQGQSDSDKSDKAKYGITALNFTEYRTNETNPQVTLFAQAYVNTSRYLIVNVYAKCTESWHGVSITEIHGAASYAMVPNDGGDYRIRYYGYNGEQTPHPDTVDYPVMPSDTMTYKDPANPEVTLSDYTTKACDLINTFSHTHGNLSYTGLLSSSLNDKSVTAYITSNPVSSIELAIAVTPKTNDSTWDTDHRKLSGSGIFFKPDSWSVLRQDGTWGGQPIEGMFAPYAPYYYETYSPGRITSMYIYNTSGTGAQTSIKEFIVNGNYYDNYNSKISDSSVYTLIPRNHLLNDISRPDFGYKHGTLMIGDVPVGDSRASQTRFKVGGVCDAASANITTTTIYDIEALLFDVGDLTFTISQTYGGGATIWAKPIVASTVDYLMFSKRGHSTYTTNQQSTYSRSTGTFNQGSKLSIGNFSYERSDNSYCYQESKLYVKLTTKTPKLYRIDIAHYASNRYLVTAECIECPTVDYKNMT